MSQIWLQHLSKLELHPVGETYENIENNEGPRESSKDLYEDLHIRPLENTGEYQELVKKPETSVKLIIHKPEITYENTNKESQSTSETKTQSEPSQYEKLNTRNEKNDQHTYSEVSFK